MLTLSTFESSALGPAFVNGIMSSTLYGILAVALVLSFRMSRTVAFVHGGIALGATFLYWYLTSSSIYLSNPHAFPVYPAMAAVVGMGALFGLVYGTVVMGKRMASWPRVTVTTFSLGVMLLIAGVFASLWPGLDDYIQSPFGNQTLEVLSMNVTLHQIVTLGIFVLLVAVLSYGLLRTRAGIYVRAIGDDVEAAEMVGIPTAKVGIGVWMLSGGIAALAGILLAPAAGISDVSVLFILLRSLTVAVLGGALLLGEVENLIGGGVFGSIPSGTREVILMTLVFGIVLALTRRGRGGARLQAQAL
ncbi:MAG TPA: branched-chain amino acid ABC transporter permease [Acidimicrobiia bacterium]|nr:branched-chain amino acid ABC transporter permease [Acidimicrobiia bacterium]